MADLFEKAKNYVTDTVANIKKPEAELTDVDVTNFSMNSVSLNAKISVTNPYSHSIPICEISYVLKSVDREIASGTIPDPGSLKGNDVTLLLVPVKIPYSILLTLAKDVGRDWDIDYELQVGLIIDLPVIGNITIPLSQKGEIKLPTVSDFFGGSKEETVEKAQVVQKE